MTLDELLLQLRYRRLILIREQEIWPSPALTREICRALRRHKKGLRVLLGWSSIDVCASRDLHRRYWKYCGNGYYICEICQRISAA